MDSEVVKRKIPDTHSTEKVCRTCLGIIPTDNGYSLLRDTTHVLNILQSLIPHFDTKIVSEAVICNACNSQLDFITAFRDKCIQSEEKLNCYIRQLDDCKILTNADLLIVATSNTNVRIKEENISCFEEAETQTATDDIKHEIGMDYENLDIKQEELMLKSEDSSDSFSSFGTMEEDMEADIPGGNSDWEREDRKRELSSEAAEAYAKLDASKLCVPICQLLKQEEEESNESDVESFHDSKRESFLQQFLEGAKQAGANANNCLLLRYLTDEPTLKDTLGIHQLLCRFKTDREDCKAFLDYARQKMTTEAIQEALEATVTHKESNLWHELCYGRITTGNIYKISRCNSADDALITHLFQSSYLYTVTPYKQRRDEVIAIVERERKQSFVRVGMKVSAENPLIGATTDCVSEDFVLQVKCPNSAKAFKSYIEDNAISPKYYAQMQLQMFMFHKSRGLFCVADPSFEDTKEIQMVTVDFDEKFTDGIVAKAVAFWEKWVFPCLYKSTR